MNNRSKIIMAVQDYILNRSKQKSKPKHRRNLLNVQPVLHLEEATRTPDQMSLIRGRVYNRKKKQGMRSDLTSGQNVHKSKTDTTATKLAFEFGVDERNPEGQRTLFEVRNDSGY